MKTTLSPLTVGTSLVALLIALALGGCVDEPAPKDAQAAAVTIEKQAADEQIKETQLSIEQAADEAVKLIEADAKAESDSYAGAGE